MGEYEPKDSRNLTGRAANDPARQNRQMQQSGQNRSSGQPQQFQDTTGQQGGGGGAGRLADRIAKHQEVVDAQGNHVGTVDHVEGDRIKLTKADSADGRHRYVSLSQVQGIEGGRIRLSGSGDVAR